MENARIDDGGWRVEASESSGRFGSVRFRSASFGQKRPESSRSLACARLARPGACRVRSAESKVCGSRRASGRRISPAFCHLTPSPSPTLLERVAPNAATPNQKTAYLPPKNIFLERETRIDCAVHSVLVGRLRLSPRLTSGAIRPILRRRFRGRTGFDLKNTPEAACRGRFVGLVNHRTKNKC